jgi:hypothetical protein
LLRVSVCFTSSNTVDVFRDSVYPRSFRSLGLTGLACCASPKTPRKLEALFRGLLQPTAALELTCISGSFVISALKGVSRHGINNVVPLRACFARTCGYAAAVHSGQLKYAHCGAQLPRLFVERRRGRGGLFDERRVLLRDLVHLRHCAAHLFDSGALFV